MKTKKLEKWLLLEQSGELSTKQCRRLGRELAVSDEARRLRAELSALAGSIQKPDVELAPWAVTKITARLREERRPAFAGLSKPVLALAACLALVAGILNFHGQTSSTSTVVVATAEAGVWNEQFEEDLVELENLIVAISGDPLDIMEM